MTRARKAATKDLGSPEARAAKATDASLGAGSPSPMTTGPTPSEVRREPSELSHAPEPRPMICPNCETCIECGRPGGSNADPDTCKCTPTEVAPEPPHGYNCSCGDCGPQAPEPRPDDRCGMCKLRRDNHVPGVTTHAFEPGPRR